MSRLDELIAEHCPGGVPVKTMGEIGELVRGNGMPKTDLTETGVGAIHYGQIYTYYGTFAAETISFVAPSTATRLAKVDPGDIIITNTSENLGDVGKAVAWLGDQQIVTGGHATVFKHDQDPRFIAYWLQSPSFQRQKRRLATGTKVIDVSARQLATVKIPVPPLAIQREVASILDKMERLEAELEAELEYRSRQYAFYRHALLTSGGDVEWTTLGGVCSKVFSGGTPLSTKPEYYGGDIPWLRTQEVDYADIRDTAVAISTEGLQNSSAKWVRENSVIVAISGAGITRGRVAMNRIPLTTNQHCCNLEVDETIAYPRFVYYWLVNHYDDLRSRGQGNRSDLNVGIIKGYPIALPPIESQLRIATLLDWFERLVNDLSVGLPAEIRARRKQYEHYRDRLLTFEEAVA